MFGTQPSLAKLLCLSVCGFLISLSSAFLQPLGKRTSAQAGLAVVQDFERPPTFLDERGDDGELSALFVDDYDDDEEDEPTSEMKAKGTGRQRWENLNPKIKERLIEKGQQKAVINKKKREPAADKKMRMMMHFKQLQQEKKRASRVERPLGFEERAPLSAFSPGMEVTGVVISMTNFGVYVDVGTECDGLLHISQITRDFFVEHPKQVFSPGDEITVKVRSTSSELKKMQLTMLKLEDDQMEDDDGEERIPLTGIEPDDELWGVMQRVTDYGAFVEVGAVVDGFMHFMDHPSWENGLSPSEFMERGQRVRVWVLDVDREQRRIKLTGNRPTHLPGPRVEF